jgi:hypothetical protein
LQLTKDLDTRDSSQSKKSKKGLRTLLRELSDDDDDAGAVNTGPNIPNDPYRPWFGSFRAYLDAVEQVPDGLSAVKWWGVSVLIRDIILSQQLTYNSVG